MGSIASLSCRRSKVRGTEADLLCRRYFSFAMPVLRCTCYAMPQSRLNRHHLRDMWMARDATVQHHKVCRNQLVKLTGLHLNACVLLLANGCTARFNARGIHLSSQNLRVSDAQMHLLREVMPLAYFNPPALYNRSPSY